MLNNKIFAFSLLLILLCLGSCKETPGTQNVKKTGNKALDDLNEYIVKDSLNPVLYFERAKLYYENQYFDGAISDLQKAISIDSLKPDYFHLLSDCYLDYFRSKESLMIMEECVKKFPDRIPSLLKLSEIQLILKQFDNSLGTASKVLSLNPQNAEAYFMMGLNLRSTGDIARSKNAFRKATELDPELVDAWIILGQLFEDEKNPKALDYYEAAINVDAKNPRTWHSKAYYLQNNNQLEEALKIYREINLIDKNYLDAYLNSGIIYLSMDSLDQAYDQFNIMTKIKPQYFLPYYYRGLVNETKGRIAEAKDDYNVCLRLNSNYDKAKIALNDLNASN